MSNENKEIIKDVLIDSINDASILDEVSSELDHVYAESAEYKEYRADTEKLYNRLKAKGEKEIQKYKDKTGEIQKQNSILSGKMDTLKINLDYYKKQSAKADECEAKAKAWDNLMAEIDEIQSEVKDINLSPMLSVKTIGIATLKSRREYESGESEWN